MCIYSIDINRKVEPLFLHSQNTVTTQEQIRSHRSTTPVKAALFQIIIHRQLVGELISIKESNFVMEWKTTKYVYPI